MLSSDESLLIVVASRASALAQAQVKEVLQAINAFYPYLRFQLTYLSTTGDRDKKTSLRTLDKTDFFTKEIDELQLQGGCRISVHSAKDLPDPLRKGLKVVALTRGVSAADVLVLRAGEDLRSLPSGAIIATSSQRREEVAQQMREDLCFQDLRGVISERLSLLDAHLVDGVIVAEAALIRLGLTHLNYLRLPGETAQFQGRLAVVAREDDNEMTKLFSVIDAR